MYGYVGSEDFTMYPLLPPGTFFRWTKPETRLSKAYGVPNWSVHLLRGNARRIYLLLVQSERRDIVLHSHPLSPVPVRVLRHPQEAEVIGQVVGIALKLGEWRPVESLPEPKAESKERVTLN